MLGCGGLRSALLKRIMRFILTKCCSCQYLRTLLDWMMMHPSLHIGHCSSSWRILALLTTCCAGSMLPSTAWRDPAGRPTLPPSKQRSEGRWRRQMTSGAVSLHMHEAACCDTVARNPA